MTACACCEPAAIPTPAPVFNRPGLPRIAYRIGTCAAFREAMVEAAAHRAELRDWTARSDDDFGMALLDCWSYVADILTFYTERTANESYLRTAALSDSVRRLAGLLGYRPAAGLAARAQLVLTLDAGRALDVPAGLRVKSVPGPGERAVTFETSAPLAASAALNAVPVLGPELDIDPWAVAADGTLPTGGPVDPEFHAAVRAALRPGTDILAYTPGGIAAEEKRVRSVTQRGPVLDLRFEPWAGSTEFQNAGTAVLARWTRRLRLFGHDAPPTWMQQYTTSAGEVRFREVHEGDNGYELRVPGGARLQLDRVVDGLAQGSVLVFATSEAVFQRIVISATTVAASAGPMSATVTEVELDAELFNVYATRPSVRPVTVYELRPPVISLWSHDFPASITGSRILAALPVDPPAIGAGRAVVLDDAAQQPVLATVVAAGVADTHGAMPAQLLQLDLDAPLPRPLDAATAIMYANVADATHGETVARERLGAGDATVPFQRFALTKAPLTHVRAAGAPHGAAPALEVRVAGLLWHRADLFYGRGPGDRVYAVEIGDDATPTVRFGDGETGMRPATGAEIVARYRQGLGRDGLVRPGQLSQLLDRPLGLKAARNPLPAAGAADAERLEQARVNGPDTVRTFDRVVSLRDFEDAARASALVAKARAAFTTVGGDPAVALTVAGEDGAHLDSAAMRDLRADLDAQRDRYRRLDIIDYDAVPLAIELIVVARDPDRDPGDVDAAVRAAVEDLMAFEQREFGRPVHASDVLAAAQRANGVVGLDLQRLRLRDDPTSGPVMAHVPIADGELATLDPADLTVTVR